MWAGKGCMLVDSSKRAGLMLSSHFWYFDSLWVCIEWHCLLNSFSALFIHCHALDMITAIAMSADFFILLLRATSSTVLLFKKVYTNTKSELKKRSNAQHQSYISLGNPFTCLPFSFSYELAAGGSWVEDGMGMATGLALSCAQNPSLPVICHVSSLKKRA